MISLPVLSETTTLRDSRDHSASTGLSDVRRIADLGADAFVRLLTGLGLALERVPDGQPIPGSYWGDDEAGLIGDRLYVRADTPVHSALHEAGHYACMDPLRRQRLHTDALADDDEESAVCYWQICAADHVAGIDRRRLCHDMDRWGYSFRLGSTAAWFAEDAEDARAWLVTAGLFDPEADSLRPVARRG